jgi:hypothetical protein
MTVESLWSVSSRLVLRDLHTYDLLRLFLVVVDALSSDSKADLGWRGYFKNLIVISPSCIFFMWAHKNKYTLECMQYLFIKAIMPKDFYYPCLLWQLSVFPADSCIRLCAVISAFSFLCVKRYYYTVNERNAPRSICPANYNDSFANLPTKAENLHDIVTHRTSVPQYRFEE